ncbi:hypothetical protein ACFLU4_01270 [Chloroflexota bacterium]
MASKVETYTRYPLSSVLSYNGVTVLHYLLGGFGIVLGYNLSGLSYLFGALYLAFALIQMYLLLPLTVCPNCVYYRMSGSFCISGMNLVSKKIAKEGKLEDLPKRAKGPFCYNNLYLAALIIPIAAMIPALILNFSFILLAVLLVVVGLLLFRFFFVFTHVACVHCAAKTICPNAKAMGLA